jgi:hypothetical protein
MAKTPDYDDVFRTLKEKHGRLFIPVINEAFGKNYPMNAEISAMSTDMFFTETDTKDGRKKLERRESDSVLKIENEYYVMECQSYDDDSMALRIAEYTFLVARDNAEYDIGRATIVFPRFAVIYIKRSGKTPKKTTITFRAPDGQELIYEAENVILNDFSKEYIVEKRLFPYIPFYIARYEAGIKSGAEESVEKAMDDLWYFRTALDSLHDCGELTDLEYNDLKQLVNTIIGHVTGKNQVRRKLVKVMGGELIELPSDRFKAAVKAAVKVAVDEAVKAEVKAAEAAVKAAEEKAKQAEERGEANGEKRGMLEGRAIGIIESGYENSLSDEDILTKLCRKLNISAKDAQGYLEKYKNSEWEDVGR